MPTYDYVCSDCGYEFDAYHPISYKLSVCPKCEKKSLIKKIGIGSSFKLIGDGFYKSGTV